ncbi:ribbon-helix-helix domain-containing protein [Dapis sp. BLCC M229]|uniref:ribbon-helix-helix domain-containing protein n=1 Tax=Dapis sp. BLCC M229 TaxID=3400188 RepID=UPI003CE75FFE
MKQITLTPEQEKLLEKLLNTGKYKTAQEAIARAFQLLEEEEDDIKLPSYVKGTESAKKLLKEKVKKYREEREKNKNKPIDPERARLSQELRELFDKTQAIPGSQEITEEEIAAEIEAYRRGE